MLRSFLLGLILAATAPLCAQENAPALLKRMQVAYSTLQSYSDVTSVRFRNPDGADGAQAECKIWFQRPAFFRIDGESRRAPDAPTKREVIWSDGKQVRSWSTTDPVTTHAKVQLAGSKMFGTYAYHIPTLLEASYGGPRRLHQLDGASVIGQENFEGADCYRVHGDWQGDPYEVWLGREDFLVHKIVAIYKGYEMEEIHRQISVEQNIPKEIFHFAPEKEGAPQR